ncbi:hypothetical protein DRJ17_05490 [Candidatus Woesearchaeota archaeon]|nr:MAG: hypothetical protein DRJ17_05490 [Candidatus Woesearchaeota archaeon]
MGVPREVGVGEEIHIEYFIYNDERKEITIQKIKEAIPPNFKVLKIEKGDIIGRDLILNTKLGRTRSKTIGIEGYFVEPGEYKLNPVLEIENRPDVPVGEYLIKVSKEGIEKEATREERVIKNLITRYEEAGQWEELQKYVEEKIIPRIDQLDIETAYKSINAAIKSLKHYPREKRKRIEKLLKYAKAKARIIKPEEIPREIYEALAVIANKDQEAAEKLETLLKLTRNINKKLEIIEKIITKTSNKRLLIEAKKELENIPTIPKKNNSHLQYSLSTWEGQRRQ